MSATKAIVAAVSSGVAGLAGSLITASTDGHITAVEVIVAVCAGAIAATGGGAATYAVANKPKASPVTQRTVRHVLNLPGRYVAGSQEVAVRLCVPGVTSDQVMILDRQHVKTSAATGAFQITLDPNTALDPPDTYYVVALFDADQTQIAFVVPDEEPPHDSDHLIPNSSPAAYAWLLTDLTVDDPTLPGAIYLGINTADDDITASGRNLPIFTTPGGVAKVWTPRQFGWQPDSDATTALLAMAASGEQHFDLGAEQYNFDGVIMFAEGVNIDGRGGKARGLDRAPTCFIAQSSGSQIWLRSAGFGAHRFMIDGNSLATNPLYIGGPDPSDVGAQPDLSGITVMLAAAGGAAVTIDATQNGAVHDLTLLNNGGEGLKFINHAGGWVFTRTEVTGSGSYALHGTNSGNILFVGGIFERGTSGSLSDVLIDGTVWFPTWRFLSCTFASGGSAVSGSQRYLIEHRATGTVELDSCQVAGITNEIGIGVLGVADSTFPVLQLRGTSYFTGAGILGFLEYDSAAVIEGPERPVRGQVVPYGSVPLRYTSGTPGSPAANIGRFPPTGETINRSSSSLTARASRVDGDTALRHEMWADGTTKWGDGTTQDIVLARNAAKSLNLAAPVGTVTLQVVGDVKSARNVPLRQSLTLTADDTTAAGAFAIDATLGDLVFIKLNGHNLSTIPVPSNLAFGQRLDLMIQQGSTPSSVTVPGASAGWDWQPGGDINKPIVNTTATSWTPISVRITDNGRLVAISTPPTGAPYAAVAADQTVNNTTTLANSVLAVSLDANATYTWEAYLVYDSSATGDFKSAFNWPSGATGWYSGLGAATAGATYTESAPQTTSGSAISFGGAGVGIKLLVIVNGFLTTTSAGTLQHQFAQATLDATNTVLRAGSFISARRRS